MRTDASNAARAMTEGLALRADERVADVDFAAVWAQGHATAERAGDSTENFIAWVNGCLG